MKSAVNRATARARMARHAAMTPAERVALAARLQREGVAAFMLTQGVDRPTAIRRIKALHRLGRRPSPAAIGRDD